MPDVPLAATKKIIQAYDFMPVFDQPVTEM
jgi:hypothetical protein